MRSNSRMPRTRPTAAGIANVADRRATSRVNRPAHQEPARITAWLTTKKRRRFALIVRGVQPCDVTSGRGPGG